MTTRPPPQNYEVIYGVGLLDDLHNYFPALLYDHNRFQNLTNVFHYIRHQMNNRFNLFAYGASQYQEQEVSLPNIILTPQAQTFSQAAPAFHPRHTTGGAAGGAAARPAPTETDVITNLNTAALLLSLLNTPVDMTPPARGNVIRTTGAAGSVGGLDAWFRTPVVVRPTTAVINSATELITGNDVSGNVCTICQDTIQSNVSVRRLRHCQHAYHRGCIDQWFERSVVCPTCRHDIRET